MSQSHVVSFGALIVDALGRPVRGIPEGQQISFLDEIHVTAAGTAAATALDLGKLGVDVLAVGRVGDDALATFLGVALEKSGVDTSGLIVDADHQTSATILPIRVDGSRPALHVLGANSALREEDVPWNRVGPDTVFHFGGAFILPALDGDPTARVLRRAKELGAVTTLDMALSPRPDAADVIAPALPYVDYLLPNIEEAGWIAGSEDRAEIIRWFHDRGVGTTVLTLGEGGVSVARRGGHEVVVPAFDVEVVDTSGCGDALTAGFISGLLDGLPLAEAADRGVACGSLVATGLGSDGGIRDNEQVEEFRRSAPRR
jgi:sugar/nucleoside kinase (ribokinase family)